MQRQSLPFERILIALVMSRQQTNRHTAIIESRALVIKETCRCSSQNPRSRREGREEGEEGEEGGGGMIWSQFC